MYWDSTCPPLREHYSRSLTKCREFFLSGVLLKSTFVCLPRDEFVGTSTQSDASILSPAYRIFLYTGAQKRTAYDFSCASCFLASAASAELESILSACCNCWRASADCPVFM